jgi:hypothetical protein
MSRKLAILGKCGPLRQRRDVLAPPLGLVSTGLAVDRVRPREDPRAPASSWTPRSVCDSFWGSVWGSVWGSIASERVGNSRPATSTRVKTRSVETQTRVRTCTLLLSDAPITMSED